MGDRDTAPYDALAEQQERILGTLVAGLALAALLVSPILWLEVDDHADPRFWILLILVQSFVGIYVARGWLGFRATALGLLYVLGAVSAYAACLHGPTPGTMALHAMSLLLAALFFGKRGAWLAFAACIGSVVLGGVLLTNRLVPPWYPSLWDPLLPLVWVRYAVLLTVLAGSIGLAYIQVVQGVSFTARLLNETLVRERAEREQREAVQAVLERAQRHEALAQQAAGIAHDLANSLMVAAAHAEFIRTTPGVSHEVGQDASQIRDTLSGTKELLDRLSALGRTEARRFAAIRLDAPLAWLDKALRRVLPTNVSLRTRAGIPETIAVDASRLEQALLNLGLNARDAMPLGGELDFEVSTYALEACLPGWEAKPGPFVRISCRDTGVGMDVATQQRIFEPFFTTKQPGQGTGLGLAMVRRLVYDAQGFIAVESNAGQGTAFHLYFPAGVGLSETPERSGPAGASSAPAAAGGDLAEASPLRSGL